MSDIHSLSSIETIIEAMAKAAWEFKSTMPWHQIPENWKPYYRECQRVALIALQELP